jgi:hypothetical protein
MTTPPPCTLNCISTGNFLLLGELSAIGAYEKAIAAHHATPVAFDLKRILGAHWRSVDRPTAFVNEIGGLPATDTHDWSPFADGFRNALDKPGAGWTVRALQWGEERGRDDYEEALDHEGVRENLKSLIRHELLTRVENHITMLEQLHRGISLVS